MLGAHGLESVRCNHGLALGGGGARRSGLAAVVRLVVVIVAGAPAPLPLFMLLAVLLVGRLPSAWMLLSWAHGWHGISNHMQACRGCPRRIGIQAAAAGHTGHGGNCGTTSGGSGGSLVLRNVTNPKPLDLPVYFSRMICASSTCPYWLKWCCRVMSPVCQGTLQGGKGARTRAG